LRRSTNIAREVLRRQPDASILVVADSPAAPFFLPPHGVDYVKLPTIVKTGDSSWKSNSLSMPLDDVLRLRAGLIEQTLQHFEPDAVLVDHMPVGALGELKPTIDRIKADEHGPRLVLGIRDVLDKPETIRKVWQETGAYDYLTAYDAVLVYGSSDLLDASTEYGLAPYASNVISCNFVATEAPAFEAEAPHDEPLILVMGGGGADLFPIAKTVLEALPILLAETAIKLAILPGPNMDVEQTETLTALADGRPATVCSGFEDATAWLARADAVVMMAGYNSMCEVLSARKKALVIPRPGPSSEQRIRTRLFAERGLIRALDPDELTAANLARSLMALLADDNVPDPANLPPLDGAMRAADVLLASPALQSG
jgi:predicted glycosyltransferase